MTINVNGKMKEISTKHYFLIKTTDSERSSSYKKICESYDEAVEQVQNYADWYCDRGCCKIVEVDSEFNTLRYWNFWKGKLEKN